MLQMGRDVVEAVASQVASKPRTLDAFEALSDRCVDDAYRLAAVVLRDPAEAQDVKSRLHTGLKRLRIELERAGWREEEER
jgi:DNA-directed RNA polymerase specialized sigma24 family protein